MTEAPRSREPAPSRTRILVAALVGIAYLALAALLVTDTLDPRHAGYQVVPVRTHRLVDVAESIGRARGVNPIIAVAALEAGGEKARLKLPEGFDNLLARPADDFTGKPQPTINKGLIDPFLAGRIEVADYDPVLTAAQAEELEADPALVELPMDVWLLPATNGDPHVVFYTDPSRMRIYIVPAGLIEGAADSGV